MGLDRFHHTPCGFCSVEFVRRQDALAAVSNLNATKLDGRVIRVDLDAGFQQGRQFGRGTSGGQVRDERRALGLTDPGRNKRPKTLNWTPPEHVRQQQLQQGQTADPSLDAYGPTAGGGGATEVGDSDMAGQGVNSRFRDES